KIGSCSLGYALPFDDRRVAGVLGEFACHDRDLRVRLLEPVLRLLEVIQQKEGHRDMHLHSSLIDRLGGKGVCVEEPVLCLFNELSAAFGVPLAESMSGLQGLASGLDRPPNG